MGSVDGHKHLRISWTALTRFDECPRQDHLTRNGFRQDIADKRNFLCGNVVDNAMREWLDQDHPQPGDLVGRADAIFNKYVASEVITWRGPEDKATLLATCREALGILEPWLTENVLPFPYQPEMRGVAMVNIPDQSGEMQRVELFYATDITVLRDEKYEIYDLKTTRNQSYVKGKTLAQLTFYAIAVSAAMGVSLRDIKKTAFITPLTPEMETAVSPTIEDIQYMMARITAYAHAVWAGHMPTKKAADSDCAYRCEVRNFCPIGGPPVANKDGRVSFIDLARTRTAASEGFKEKETPNAE